MIKMILASTKDGGIGLDNKLPFHCPEDLKYFKEQTEGEIVVMGRKTFDSLPFEHGLPNRENIILTSLFKPNTRCNETIYTNIQELLDHYKNSGDLWVIGGKSLYEQLFNFVSEVHHTVIKGEHKCDTFIDTSMWEDDIDWCLEEVKILSEVAEVRIWRKC
uniref:dihydrofolate reductase n=1 Tax=Vibrio phage P018-4 TaxID=3229728 RepID=A0AB39AJV3_9CAUD